MFGLPLRSRGLAGLARSLRRARPALSASDSPGRRRRTGERRRAASSRSRASGRPSRGRGRVISPGTGNGQPPARRPRRRSPRSAVQPPLSLRMRHIVLESAAPAKPCSASGSWSQRTSSGTRPFSPRSTVCSSVRFSRFQKWSRPRSVQRSRRRGRSRSRRRSARRTPRRRGGSCAAGTRSRRNCGVSPPFSSGP